MEGQKKGNAKNPKTALQRDALIIQLTAGNAGIFVEQVREERTEVRTSEGAIHDQKQVN